MEEEQEVQESVSIETETVESETKESEKSLESFSRLEDFAKSDREVKTSTQIEGVTRIEQKTQTKDRIFTRKSDEKKVYIKKRLKIVTTVYTTVAALLFGFIISNIVTLAILNKSVNTYTDTIQTEQTQLMIEESKTPTGESVGDFQISLNEPRDYSEDKKELTWLDKITILFRNLFS